MASFYDFERVYGPDTLKIITAVIMRTNASQQSTERMTAQDAG
jgi:hypothetical protein